MSWSDPPLRLALRAPLDKGRVPHDHGRMRHARIAPGLVVALALALAGCGARVARLEPPEAAGGRGAVRVVDRRADRGGPIGASEHRFSRASYDVDADGDVGPWLEGHVTGALGPRSGGGRLEVALLRFELRGATWVRGEAVFDLTLTRDGGERVSRRLTVVTTELMTDDGDLAWTQTAERLARWSAVEITRWVRTASPPS